MLKTLYLSESFHERFLEVSVYLVHSLERILKSKLLSDFPFMEIPLQLNFMSNKKKVLLGSSSSNQINWSSNKDWKLQSQVTFSWELEQNKEKQSNQPFWKVFRSKKSLKFEFIGGLSICKYVEGPFKVGINSCKKKVKRLWLTNY